LRIEGKGQRGFSCLRTRGHNQDRKEVASRVQISYKALSYKMQEYKISQRWLAPAGEQKSRLGAGSPFEKV